MLWGNAACSPRKCLSSVYAKEEFWAEFCARCCHFVFSCWQDKWINTRNNKLRNMNFTLLMGTNTERGFYIKKHLKYTFIIYTTLSPWQLYESHYASLACLASMNFISFMSMLRIISLFQSFSCRVIIYCMLVTKLNYISDNSFCWPCCGNVSVILPEDSALRGETCQSYAVLMKWC